MRKIHYNSLYQFRKHLETNEDTKTVSNSSHRLNDKGFRGTNSFKEALELLDTGDRDILQALKKATKKELHGIDSQPSRYLPSVQGEFFDVAKVLIGEPESWYKLDNTNTKIPAITIEVGIAYPSNVRTSEVVVNAGLFIARIKELELAGIQVGLRIVAATDLTHYKEIKEKIKVSIDIKQPNTPINYRTISAVLHPSFFRRCLFRQRELLYPDKNLGGYGITIPQPIDIMNRDSIKNIGVKHD
jgi:hypothetical protein